MKVGVGKFMAFHSECFRWDDCGDTDFASHNLGSTGPWHLSAGLLTWQQGEAGEASAVFWLEPVPKIL